MNKNIIRIEKERKNLKSNKKMGAIYSKESTIFRVWSPVQEKIELCIYNANMDIIRDVYLMEKDQDGTFECEVIGDLRGKFYTYKIGDYEVTDPYSFSSSMNSTKSAIVDLDKTDPVGFRNHEIPKHKIEESIIYEASIKDFTSDYTSGNPFRGKFLSLTQEGTEYLGEATGLDHLVDLGITHLHLMPIFDFITVDENPINYFNDDNYNWGYDPELYNVPEGSYSINPRDPEMRIYELKEMVMKLHEKGIGVIMDVVYNHTYKTLDSNFNIIYPNYYYRQYGNAFSNGSGCGNDFASERPMARKFVIDSLKYWQREFKIDGFRFDLMALIDKDTINIALSELKKENPNVLIYGEPWMALDTSLIHEKRVLFGSQIDNGFALFNSRFRDAIKGDNDGYAPGFVQGEYLFQNEVEKGIVGNVDFDSIRNGILNNTTESINYFNSHDNLILQDKLSTTNNDGDIEEVKAWTKLCFGILMFSQGIPFFHSGNEFMRSKEFYHNTYNLPLDINAINWNDKINNIDIYNYVKDIISFRREHDEFRIVSKEDVKDKITFIDNTDFGHILYLIKNRYGYLLISHNCKKDDIEYDFKDIFEGVGIKEIRLVFDKNGKRNKVVDENLIFSSQSSMAFEIYLGEENGL